MSCITTYKQQLGRNQVSHVNVGEGQTELSLTGRCVSGHRRWQNSHEEYQEHLIRKGLLENVRLPDLKARPLRSSRLSSYMKRMS